MMDQAAKPSKPDLQSRIVRPTVFCHYHPRGYRVSCLHRHHPKVAKWLEKVQHQWWFYQLLPLQSSTSGSRRGADKGTDIGDHLSSLSARLLRLAHPSSRSREKTTKGFSSPFHLPICHYYRYYYYYRSCR